MGQYHEIVNLTKREYIHPHRLGCGLKLREQANTSAGSLQALFAALVISPVRGGGDFIEHPWVGRWKGDRIAVVGDYSEKGDLPQKDHPEIIYNACHDADTEAECEHKGLPCFKDVSDIACDFLEVEWNFKFQGKGWRDRKYADGRNDNPAAAPDFVIRVPKAPE